MRGETSSKKNEKTSCPRFSLQSCSIIFPFTVCPSPASLCLAQMHLHTYTHTHTLSLAYHAAVLACFCWICVGPQQIPGTEVWRLWSKCHSCPKVGTYLSCLLSVFSWELWWYHAAAGSGRACVHGLDTSNRN